MQKVNYEEALAASINYFEGDELAATVWISKYALKDRQGNLYEKSPEDMHHRLAREFARIEAKYPNPRSEDDIFNAIDHFRYIIPQGSPMSGIGNDFSIQSISNCFVVDSPYDSYGGIMRTDEELLQIEKRRGGCIEENTNVIIKGKGIIKIKDVRVGDEILAFDIKTRKDTWRMVNDVYITDVKLEDQVLLKYKNGTILETSRKHPVLKLSDKEYKFESVESGSLDGSWNKSPNFIGNVVYNNTDSWKSEIAWTIGCHLGDGTCDKNNRIRITDDCETIVKSYAENINKIVGSHVNYSKRKDERYRVDMWDFASKSKKNSIFVNLIDNQVGVKSHTCFIPKFIKENDLYPQFIAGFVDTDGYITKSGRIEMDSTSPFLMDEIANYLSSKGQRFLYKKKISRRDNEKPIYKIHIFKNTPIYKEIVKFMKNENKINRINEYNFEKIQSSVIKLTKAEVETLNDYTKVTFKNKKDSDLYRQNIKNMNLRGGFLSMSGLVLANKYNIISKEQLNEICSRIQSDAIIEDCDTKKTYYDISVEIDNNYYAGKHGFVNIHNCGLDLSNLRPSDSPVSNAARTSTGVASFMERYSNSTREVAMQARRGALMLSLSVHHPDADKFIDAKTEQGKVTGANISVRLSDEFMNAVKADGKFTQKFPVDSDNPTITKEINAKDLWKKIIHNAWRSAEPGVLFWDTIIRESLPDCYKELGYKSKSVNPCVSYETTLLTKDGYKPIGELVGHTLDIWNGLEWTSVTPFKTSDNADVYMVKFSDGSHLRCTEYHKFILANGERKELRNCKVGDMLASFYIPEGDVLKERVGITITSIEHDGKEATYCVTDEKNHSALFNQVMTGQCGELILSPYDSCRLLSLNLYSFVEKPFTNEAWFNHILFVNTVRLAMRMMDDLVDLELEKIDKIIAKVESDPEPDDVKAVELNLWKKIRSATSRARRTGLGITAEGDMLAALGMRYASEEAISFSAEVHKTIAVEAYRESAVMAGERGTFEVYDKELEKDNPFLNRIMSADDRVRELIEKNGRRNIGCLTIAPTGTTSLMSQTTSGIEPVFMPFYKRRRKVNPDDRSANITFRDEVGDCYEEYYVFHHKFLTWCEVNGYDIETVKGMPIEDIKALVVKSPYHLSTSEDIDWVAKVKMQGEIQKWVDHSISVTVNLPENATEEIVEKVYMTAWESGCKGMTIYRAGSRAGVLVSADKKEEPKSITKPVKRPQSLEADVVRFRNGGENWIAFIGKLNNAPYEIFTGVVSEDTINIPKNIEKGWIVRSKDKEGNSVYNFEYINRYGYPQVIGGISYMFNKEYWNYARFISGVLRNNVPIVDVLNIINSLSLNDDSINTWKNGVARALKQYIPDGTKDETGKKCSQCGAESLVYQEGCLVCTNCGYSKCG